VFDTLAAVKATVEMELNAVTDNPVVLSVQRRVLHGGNFHGDYVSSSMDQLRMAIVKLTMLSERRINFLLNPNIKHPWQPFLNLRVPGLNLGLQGLQFVATSTTARSQTLAYPQSVHSIPTNGDNQDVVSLGTDAALLTHLVIQQAFVVVCIETIVLAQAVDSLGIAGDICETSHALYESVREVMAPVTEDRVVYPELAALLARWRAGHSFAGIVGEHRSS